MEGRDNLPERNEVQYPSPPVSRLHNATQDHRTCVPQALCLDQGTYKGDLKVQAAPNPKPCLLLGSNLASSLATPQTPNPKP